MRRSGATVELPGAYCVSTLEGGVPVIFADEIGEVEVIGNRVRITYVEFRQVAGEIVKQPVLEVIRPLESIGQGLLIRLVNEALAAKHKPVGEAIVTH